MKSKYYNFAMESYLCYNGFIHQNAGADVLLVGTEGKPAGK